MYSYPGTPLSSRPVLRSMRRLDLKRAVPAATLPLPVSVHTLRRAFPRHRLKIAAGTVVSPFDTLAASGGVR